nr:heme-binding protein [Citrobacter sp. Res13-Sevr-PEB04-36]
MPRDIFRDLSPTQLTGDTVNKSHPIATITLAAAQQMATAVEVKALEINVPVVFSVVDHGGNTLLMQRMDEAFVSSCDISLNKAWTACCLRQGTHEITDAVQPGASLYGLQLTNQQRIIIFGGGLPVILNGKVIGAVGVSGGTVEQDQLLAETALHCFSEL